MLAECMLLQVHGGVSWPLTRHLGELCGEPDLTGRGRQALLVMCPVMQLMLQEAPLARHLVSPMLRSLLHTSLHEADISCHTCMVR